MNIKNPKVLAIIPARANSKRVKLKNIKPFFGKPIIDYSITAALDSELFDEVMISTDSSEIQQHALSRGAKVPFMRSAKNSDDHSTLADVVIEVINSYKKDGIEFDHICCILATAPFLKAQTLETSYDKFIQTQARSLYPIVEYQQTIQRSFKITQGKVEMFWPEFYNTRSQDLEKSYYDAGQFYWIHSDEILKNSSFLTSHTVPFILSSDEVQDIDTEQDWKLAEEKFHSLNLGKPHNIDHKKGLSQ